ncbi:hypothetical protein M758_UG232800 [Ceratodon purpureus]|nr:hypothetical protein M758_UG232800 [Ceratodon purpureus]
MMLGLPNGCRMVWSYFGSGHGKGLHDGARAMLKCAIRKEEMNFDSRTKLQNAADVVSFCICKEQEEHRAYRNVKRTLICYFHLIEPGSVDRSRDLDYRPVLGTRSLHSVSSVSPTNVTYLHIRQLACFCPNCTDDNSMLCARQEHVRHWALKCYNYELQFQSQAHEHDFKEEVSTLGSHRLQQKTRIAKLKSPALSRNGLYQLWSSQIWKIRAQSSMTI